MNNFYLLLISILCSLFSSIIFAQDQDTSTTSEWKFEFETDLYFTDPFVFLPIFIADRGNLHLETRYNYEDIKTASAWVGYNIIGRDELEYFITPMVGGAFGRTNGIVVGIELTFGFAGFELYSETEYLFDVEGKSNGFFYIWNDLTYSPLDGLWFGISAQRARVFNADLTIDRGVIFGFEIKNIKVNSYLYSNFQEAPFIMLALSTNF